MKNKKWICTICGSSFNSKRQMQQHRKEAHPNCKPIQKKELKTCQFCGKVFFSNLTGLKMHEKYCADNPSKEIRKGHPLSEETRKHLSEIRLKNIRDGKISPHFPSRKKCEPSYPEKWFMKELKENYNLVEGEDYVRELSFHNFFLDFAWIEKKFCVEIDGEQHHQFQDRIEKDQKKDFLLKEEGWTEIRADWKYICNNKKEFMDNFFNILNSLDSKNEDPKKYSFLGHRDLRDHKEREKLKSEGRIDSLGRVSKKITSEKEWEERKKLILDSGVDLNKFGYVEKVVRATGLTKRQVRNTILKYNINHFERKCI